MKYCNLVISNDAELMHLAYAVDTPSIAIFSSRYYSCKLFTAQDSATLQTKSFICKDCCEEYKNYQICLLDLKPHYITLSLRNINKTIN